MEIDRQKGISLKGKRRAMFFLFASQKKIDVYDTNVLAIDTMHTERAELPQICGRGCYRVLGHWSSTQLPIWKIIFVYRWLHQYEAVLQRVRPPISHHTILKTPNAPIQPQHHSKAHQDDGESRHYLQINEHTDILRRIQVAANCAP